MFYSQYIKIETAIGNFEVNSIDLLRTYEHVIEEYFF